MHICQSEVIIIQALIVTHKTRTTRKEVYIYIEVKFVALSNRWTETKKKKKLGQLPRDRPSVRRRWHVEDEKLVLTSWVAKHDRGGPRAGDSSTRSRRTQGIAFLHLLHDRGSARSDT